MQKSLQLQVDAELRRKKEMAEEEERKEVRTELGLPHFLFAGSLGSGSFGPGTWKEVARRRDVEIEEMKRVEKERDEDEEEEKKKLEGEVQTLRTELVMATKKEKEAEDVEMGGIGSPSWKTNTDAAMNTETRTKTYAQAAVQTQAEKREEKEKRKGNEKEVWGKGKGAGLSQRFRFVEDMSKYEEKDAEKQGTMTKAVVVHGVSTNWRVNGVADCMERIIGRVIRVRWLLGVGRRVGKTASSVVVYLDREVLLAEASIKMAGKRHSIVPYRWRS